MSNVVCPICAKQFPLTEIDKHVNECCDSISNPAPIENKTFPVFKSTMTPAEKPVILEKKRPAEQNDPGSEEDEYFNHFKRKKLQEEEDAKLAALLQNQLEQEKAQNKLIDHGNKDSDLALAMEMMEKEEQEYKRKIEEIQERDAKIAKELAEAENQKLESKKVEANEFEATLQIIKEESTRDKEQELLKTRQEKEKLQKELEKLKAEQKDVKNKKNALVEYPEYWKNQNEDFVVFDINANSDEWATVQARFSEALPGAVILTIQRNQNQDLWKWYYLKRKEIARKNKDGNEQYLFYESRGVVLNSYNNQFATMPYAGRKKKYPTQVANNNNNNNNAGKDNLDDLLKNGIDPRVADLNGTLGAGVYFTSNSSVADKYSTKNRGASKQMLLCRVALGDIGKGQANIRRPPEKGKGYRGAVNQYDAVPVTTGAAVILYDSTGHGDEYCIFENRQSYPEYIIEYDDGDGMQIDNNYRGNNNYNNNNYNNNNAYYNNYDDDDDGQQQYYPPNNNNNNNDGWFNGFRNYFGYK